MADKLWNKLTTAASGHKKRLISCPWVCCWCAAWAQHSSRLKCENNVGRCAFDLTEWHLPRYPWDWVVKHCKDLLLPHLRCKENNSLKLNICLVTLCRGWSRRMEVCNMFFPLGSARLGSHICLLYIGPPLFGSLPCLLALTIVSLPFLLFVPIFPRLYPYLSL